MKDILKTYRPALVFISKFIGFYLVLNTAYGLFIRYYDPHVDPVTLQVSAHVTNFLGLFYDSVTYNVEPGSLHVPLMLGQSTVVNVFEGCNGLNVMIVYACFLFAFRGTPKQTIFFFTGGIVVIYLMNLLRVVALFEVAMKYPSYLYLVHKYVFTGFIYTVVFAMWFIWIKTVGKREHQTAL